MQKPNFWNVDREEETEKFKYENQYYDWLSQYTLTEWINKKNWERRKQQGIVKTEAGWGLLGFNRRWIIRPGDYKIRRIKFHSHGSYPPNVYVKVNYDNTTDLLDAGGNWLGSFRKQLDPYEAVNKVKQLTVSYEITHGSVFSVPSTSDYEAKSTLRSYADNLFESYEWKAFEPTGKCDGWMVQLKSTSDIKKEQYWYVADEEVYEIRPDRRDFIRTNASKKSHQCVTNFRIPPEDTRFYLASDQQY